jgi:hypothetical protein
MTAPAETTPAATTPAETTSAETGHAGTAPPVVRVEALVYRCPIDTPVVTSFGTMHDRPMLLVRVEDNEGAVGWGEVWCNFPAVGAEHRARLISSVLAPIVLAAPSADPAAMFALLTGRTAVLALQSGEPGPLAQAIAGIAAPEHRSGGCWAAPAPWCRSMPAASTPTRRSVWPPRGATRATARSS